MTNDMDTRQGLEAPSLGCSAPRSKKPWVFVAAAAVGLLVPGLAFCTVAIQYGSAGAVFARLRGDKLYIEQPDVTLTSVAPNRPARAQFDITNTSARPMRILSVSATCDCAMLLEKDIAIPPSETQSVPFEFAIKSPLEKPFRVKIYLLFDGQDNAVQVSATMSP